MAGLFVRQVTACLLLRHFLRSFRKYLNFFHHSGQSLPLRFCLSREDVCRTQISGGAKLDWCVLTFVRFGLGALEDLSCEFSSDSRPVKREDLSEHAFCTLHFFKGYSRNIDQKMMQLPRGVGSGGNLVDETKRCLSCVPPGSMHNKWPNYESMIGWWQLNFLIFTPIWGR